MKVSSSSSSKSKGRRPVGVQWFLHQFLTCILVLRRSHWISCAGHGHQPVLSGALLILCVLRFCSSLHPHWISLVCFFMNGVSSHPSVRPSRFPQKWAPGLGLALVVVRPEAALPPTLAGFSGFLLSLSTSRSAQRWSFS